MTLHHIQERRLAPLLPNFSLLTSTATSLAASLSIKLCSLTFKQFKNHMDDVLKVYVLGFTPRDPHFVGLG